MVSTPIPPFKDTVRRADGKIVPPDKVKAGNSGTAATPPVPTNGAVPLKTSTGTATRQAAVRPLARFQDHLPPLEPGRYRPNELVVRNLTPETMQAALAAGFTAKGGVPPQGSAAVTTLITPKNSSLRQSFDLLRGLSPPETSIFANYIYRLPTDSKILPKGLDHVRSVVPVQPAPCPPDRCFGAKLIGWTSEARECAASVAIGVIDTFVDFQHPTFSGRTFNVGISRPANERVVETAHGTGVMSVLAGGSETGTPGLIPEASFFSTDIFFADEQGQPMSDTASLIRALDLMHGFEVDIINLSVAGPYDPAIETEIERLAKDGIIIVAAAGNDGPSGPASYPAAYKSVVAVTAVNRELGNYRYATHGKYIDFSAPGVDIWTAVPGAKEGSQSGTSFAVPFATAVVAATLGTMPRKPTKKDVLASVPSRDLGAPGRDDEFGFGLAQAPASCRTKGHPAPGHKAPLSDPALVARGAPADNIPDARVTPVSDSPDTAIGRGAPERSSSAWKPVSSFAPSSR